MPRLRSKKQLVEAADRPFVDYLRRQSDLQRQAYGLGVEGLTGDDALDFITWNVLAAQAELAEVLAEVCWKPWATYEEGQVFKDREKYIEELVDVAHFIANLLIVAGVDDEALSAAFVAKQAKNAARQETGYAGDGDAWDKEHS